MRKLFSWIKENVIWEVEYHLGKIKCYLKNLFTDIKKSYNYFKDRRKGLYHDWYPVDNVIYYAYKELSKSIPEILETYHLNEDEVRDLKELLNKLERYVKHFMEKESIHNSIEAAESVFGTEFKICDGFKNSAFKELRDECTEKEKKFMEKMSLWIHTYENEKFRLRHQLRKDIFSLLKKYSRVIEF